MLKAIGPMGLIKIGTVWKENDSRFLRLVVVVDTENSGWGKITIQNDKGRVTKASVARFNGKNRGYSPVKSTYSKSKAA